MYRGKPYILAYHNSYKSAEIDLTYHQNDYEITGRVNTGLYEALRKSDNAECYIRVVTSHDFQRQMRGARFEGLIEFIPGTRQFLEMYHYLRSDS